MILANRSNNYKDNHADFLRLINGDGYSENWIRGDRYAKPGKEGYRWIDRRYMITRPGVPCWCPSAGSNSWKICWSTWK